MKKFLFIFSICISAVSFSQDSSALNKILDKLEAKQKNMKDVSGYDIAAKKFVLIENFEDHSERHILEFNTDNNLQLIELIDDKATGETYSNIFTGDYIRKKNAISVEVNYLENKQITTPIIYNLYLANAGNIWYLKDINTGKRWIENNNLIKKKK